MGVYFGVVKKISSTLSVFAFYILVLSTLFIASLIYIRYMLFKTGISPTPLSTFCFQYKLKALNRRHLPVFQNHAKQNTCRFCQRWSMLSSTEQTVIVKQLRFSTIIKSCRQGKIQPFRPTPHPHCGLFSGSLVAQISRECVLFCPCVCALLSVLCSHG